MTFPRTAMTPPAIERALEAMRVDDADWRAARLWSLVYTAGPEHDAVLEDAHRRYANVNALSPSAFPSIARMEREVVHALLDLLGGDPDRSGGTMASGGTESILLAVKAHRDAAGLADPSMVVPSTAHPAFAKAGQLLGVRTRIVPVGTDLVADVAATAAAVDATTILLAASAPAFPYGLVDPVPELGQLALRHGIGLHVDACLGAIALPVLASLGQPAPAFDLRVPGVTSLSADLHKYGFGPKGTSTVLYRDRSLRRHQFTVHTDWPGGALVSPTLLGTRPGGAIAGAWAALHHLGLDGYERLFRGMWETTCRLREGIEALEGLHVLGDPPMTVFAFGARDRDVHAVADGLEERGWRIDRQSSPDCIHLVVTPGHAAVVDAFLHDLAEAHAAVPAGAGAGARAFVYGVTAEVPAGGDVTGALLDHLDRLYDPPDDPGPGER